MIVLVGLGCKKQVSDDIDNLNGGRIDMLGHGGLGFENPFQSRPFNSWEALTYAIESTAAEGVETDMQISRDSVPVAFHDHLLEHSTDCSGCLPLKDFAQMQGCHYSNSFGTGQHHLVRIPELLALYEDHQHAPIVLLDCKTDLPCTSTAENEAHLSRVAWAAYQHISVPGRYNRVWVLTSNTTLVQMIHAMDPEIRVYLGAASFPSDIDRAVDLGCFGLFTSYNSITRSQVDAAHDVGLRVALFNVSTYDEHIDAIEKSPDHIVSDNLQVGLGLVP